ncbi:CPBP family intramembrane glutamic endopeptidase [Streptacidiphilus griseoplanus]|uniref:CPBP family intramembrane glutamic endopeptidase n=1 Tax=Peterkaempfera griseoplana TaxID=66896 RepID=UPI000AD8F2B5|nr:CPBP family intramembrane glutamic endopeptidase [Peterkaempfera griseoplana]
MKLKLVSQVLAVVVVGAVGGQGAAAVQDCPWLSLLIGGLTAVLSVLVYRWVVARTERRPVTELAPEKASRSLLRGLVIGVAMFAAVMANIYLLGDYEVNGLGSLTGAIGLVGFMAGAAVTEELMFRGLLFRLAERGLGTYLALALSGILFGAAHLANKDATLLGGLAIAIEAGALTAMTPGHVERGGAPEAAK